MNGFVLILVLMGIIIIGGGGTYLLYIFTRPKKQTWNIKIYQLGEGERPAIKDKKGRIVSDMKLKDLRPYATDVIEKRELQPGITVYRAMKLNKPVPAITNDVVDFWGSKNKEVMGLLHDDSLTLLKKGYDSATGQIYFYPLPYDRKMMMMAESSMRKERLDNNKGLLEKIALYVTIGILVLGLVAVAYFQGNSAIKVSENNAKAAELMATKWGMPQGTPPPEIQKGEPPLIDAG